jgi:hypothetical protein
MAKRSLEDVKKEYKEFGFDPAVVEIAYANVDGQADRIIDEIIRLQSESASFPTVAVRLGRNQQRAWTRRPSLARPSNYP